MALLKRLKDDDSMDKEMFLPTAKLADFDAAPINLKYVPSLGDTVYARADHMSRPIELCEEIAAGGEGRIFGTNLDGFVAKIFKQERLDTGKEKKIRLMTSKQINCPGICFPIAALYNKENKFVGYLMRQAKGAELGRSVFLPPMLAKIFPTWKKKDMVRLCVTILEKMKYLHDRNVILGDINPANILVVSPKEVYFVDTDSYQVEGFPCPVGMPNFVAPEIQNKNFKKFLRTKGNEHFAIATLLFMVMLPGQKPYAKKGSSGNLMENIKKMDFSYDMQGEPGEHVPSGMWGPIWSHLPIAVRGAFYHTFHESGLHNCEATRYTVEEWLLKFQNYLIELELGKLGARDQNSEKIFPRELSKAVLQGAVQTMGPVLQPSQNEPILMYGLMDVTANVEKVMTCLEALKVAGSRTVLLKVLKGQDAVLREFLNRDDVDRALMFTVFGSLKSLSSTELNHLIDYLVLDEYLDPGSGRKKIMTVTSKGQPYVRCPA